MDISKIYALVAMIGALVLIWGVAIHLTRKRRK